MTKRILFLTGTRADFGKLKALIRAVEQRPEFECHVFATGMHTMERYGMTVREIQTAGFRNIHTFMNQIHGEPMELILAHTVEGLSRFVHEHKPDMIVVHGDRVEALAGAIVGALRNILVAHIEGGEVSGTTDEIVRHAVTKLSHLHFVAYDGAAQRVLQLGEMPDTIHVIGSPDYDVMFSDELPSIGEAKRRYEIPFASYGMALFHPDTGLPEGASTGAQELVSAMLNSGLDFVVVYPNNDPGCSEIFEAYRRLEKNDHFKIFPSIRFEYFISLMKNARLMVGNSSAGIREAPAHGIPSVNIGGRQLNRFRHEGILNVEAREDDILAAMRRALNHRFKPPRFHFGDGASADRFIQTLLDPDVWTTPRHKQFHDVPSAGT
jgi:UDP-N-acetylglucosamine 2-epimerase (hydrolysing)